MTVKMTGAAHNLAFIRLTATSIAVSEMQQHSLAGGQIVQLSLHPCSEGLQSPSQNWTTSSTVLARDYSSAISPWYGLRKW